MRKEPGEPPFRLERPLKQRPKLRAADKGRLKTNALSALFRKVAYPIENRAGPKHSGADALVRARPPGRAPATRAFHVQRVAGPGHEWFIRGPKSVSRRSHRPAIKCPLRAIETTTGKSDSGAWMNPSRAIRNRARAQNQPATKRTIFRRARAIAERWIYRRPGARSGALTHSTLPTNSPEEAKDSLAAEDRGGPRRTPCMPGGPATLGHENT